MQMRMGMRMHTLHELDRTGGTAQLRDVSATHGSLVLVPRPSDSDPNDPLRWPAWKKQVAFLAVCSFTFLTNYGISGLSPAFYLLSLEFDRTMAETSDLLLWPVLVLGLFNFLWVPVAGHVGKRPVFVFCSGLMCLAYVWGAVASSFESLLWSSLVAAFAGASTEALAVSMVNDLFFLHERGAKMGLYMNFITGGNTIGPLVCGFLVTGANWRWHKWIAVILTAITFAAVLLLVPETSYHRDHVAETPPVPGSLAAAVASLGSTADAEKAVGMITADSSPPRPQLPRNTWLQDLSLWTGFPPDSNMAKTFARPIPMFVYPCVLYAFLAYAVSLVLTVAVNILNPFVLQAPPYGMSPMINGLINIPGLIGNLLGGFAGGWLVDVFCDWRARRNHGVFEPENRLLLLVLPLLVTAAGCLLFGYAVERTLHWTSLFLAFGMISFALTAVPTMTMAYVSDCLLPVNADALMLVNGSKNIVAFAFLYAIIPWVDEAGYTNCFGAQAGIFVAVILAGILVLIPFGQRIRHRQAGWRIIL